MATPEEYVLRFNSPGHPHHGRFVARKRRWAAYLEFTDEQAEARVISRKRLCEWNLAFVTPELLAPANPTKEG